MAWGAPAPYIPPKVPQTGLQQTNNKPVSGQTLKPDEAKIRTLAMARDLCDVAVKTLDKAIARTDDASLYRKAISNPKDVKRKAESTRDYVRRVKDQLPKQDPLGDIHRKQVALGVRQADGILKEADSSINDPAMAFWPEFSRSTSNILSGAASGVAKTAFDLKAILIPLAIIAALVWVLKDKLT